VEQVLENKEKVSASNEGLLCDYANRLVKQTPGDHDSRCAGEFFPADLVGRARQGTEQKNSPSLQFITVPAV
jgi:hypothetical protein